MINVLAINSKIWSSESFNIINYYYLHNLDPGIVLEIDTFDCDKQCWHMFTVSMRNSSDNN